MIVITLIGPPGCGKGTQSNLLMSKLGYKHISTGNLLRSYSASNSDLGNTINECINSGQLIDDALMEKILQAEISEILKTDCKGIIFDGYPRTNNQARSFDGLLKEFDLIIKYAINFQVDDESLVKRISGRFQCIDCGEIYNEFFKKPHKKDICDVCSSTSFSRRKDDNLEVVKKRLNDYKDKSKTIIDFYKLNKKLFTVNSEKDVNSVFKEICNIINVNQDVNILCKNSKTESK